jgi:hypothetical protein
MFKRTIKDDNFFKSKDIVTVPINKEIIHPISLDIINTDNFLNPICLTKMYISNNKLNNYSNYLCNGENKYKEIIQLPPIAFDSSDLLQIYGINNIDSLKEWVENIDTLKYNHITISRVISCWINTNVDTLKTYNKYLDKICKIIMEKYILTNIRNSDDYDKNVTIFINNWIDNYDIKKNKNLLNDLLINFSKI